MAKVLYNENLKDKLGGLSLPPSLRFARATSLIRGRHWLGAYRQRAALGACFLPPSLRFARATSLVRGRHWLGAYRQREELGGVSLPPSLRFARATSLVRGRHWLGAYRQRAALGSVRALTVRSRYSQTLRKLRSISKLPILTTFKFMASNSFVRASSFSACVVV